MEEKKRIVLPVKMDGRFSYSIVLEDSFEQLARELAPLETEERRICIVTDSQVGPLYGELVRQELSKVCKKVTVYTIESGEAHKTLDTVKGLYEHLILEHFDRKDILAALGGGHVSSGSPFYPNPDDPFVPGGQQYRGKDGGGL